MARCIVGYSGGKTESPTYRCIRDHTEALLIEFDPQIVSYEHLVETWSKMHTPIGRTKCQYRSAVWFLNASQQRTAEKVVADMLDRLGSSKAESSVEPATRFYRAEEYHQNFTAKQRSGQKMQWW